jgi:hypothetical protein
VNALRKVALLSLAFIAVSFNPVLAQTGSQPERPYSVAQSRPPLSMPGGTCYQSGGVYCNAGYHMQCRCPSQRLRSGCVWVHTGARCR